MFALATLTACVPLTHAPTAPGTPPDPASAADPAADPSDHAVRALADHLGDDVSDLVEDDWTPPLPGASGWPACDPAQQAATEAALGPLQSCTAAGGLVAAAYGPAQDCPAGCFFDQAVGRWRGGRFIRVDDEVWRWLRAPQAEVLDALFVPWIVGGDASDLNERRGGLSVVCRDRAPVEPDADSPGRVARTVFDGDEGCVVSWRVDAGPDDEGRAQAHVATCALGVTGTLWVRDDGFIDGSELRFAPHDAEIARYTALTPTRSRRQVIARRTAPAAGPLCDPPSARAAVPRRLEACGPSGARVAALGFVVDGHLDPVLASIAPVLPAFEACARDTLAGIDVGPAGCVALPVAVQVQGSLRNGIPRQ